MSSIVAGESACSGCVSLSLWPIHRIICSVVLPALTKREAQVWRKCARRRFLRPRSACIHAKGPLRLL